MSKSKPSLWIVFIGLSFLLAPSSYAILAGGEFDLPADSPSGRIDALLNSSPFNAVGSLDISDGVSSYIGTGIALSPNWVLTAGHNVDLNDDGLADAGLNITMRFPGFASTHQPGLITVHPDFNGFANPSLHQDLSLLHFESSLPEDLVFPELGLSLQIGDEVILAGFGRSGYGSYGYTTSASLTDRRLGYNIIDSLEAESGGNGILFGYDFDDPDTFGMAGGSLGNDVETLIGPGDSGGPLLRMLGGTHALLGINTYTEGFGGRFGDTGGGVALSGAWDWIAGETGLAMVPEPQTIMLLLLGLICLAAKRAP